MGISDMIASFINEALNEADGTAELQRAELANRFNCVPSQINYVISTRFSPERGYIVESRRGGGGYIRISRVQMGSKALLMHTVNAIGDSIDLSSARALLSNAVMGAALDEGKALLMLAAVGDGALRPLQPDRRDELRASILKNMLIHSL
ncbi:MAG: CtsR family transcriptional regulator [Oscillospiraceae bacterium]|nr:CtsR family transcriptional regulator [Oscillospiraceae bacterium]